MFANCNPCITIHSCTIILFIDIELSEIISFEVVITSIITEMDAYTLLMENFALEWLLVKSDLDKNAIGKILILRSLCLQLVLRVKI